MSASEWARIVDERDTAIYHVKQLLDIMERFGMDEFKEYTHAVGFVAEQEGDDE